MKKIRKVAAVIISAALAVSAANALSVGAGAEWRRYEGGIGYRDEETGKRLTGWQDIDGERYCFNKEGFVLTGWNKVNGDTYYFNGGKRGRMVKGWARIKGKQYYFGTDGIMRTGWVKINGKTYYFGTDGVMLAGGSYRIHDKVCTFAADGVLTEPLSAGNFITSPLEGLVWGMTAEQVKGKLGTENIVVSGNMIICCDFEPFRYYIITSDLGLCAYGYIRDYSAEAVNSFNQKFRDEGWQYSVKETTAEGAAVYLYTSGSSCGAVVSDGSSCMTMVLSESLANGINSGTITGIAGT